MCHPGGPKVLEAIEDSLGLSREAVGLTWDSLRRIGNLSSASVQRSAGSTCAPSANAASALKLSMAMMPGRRSLISVEIRSVTAS